MPYDLSKPLVIGISSRALFDLEEENKIFEEEGLEAYIKYQINNELKVLQPGAGFELVKAFLRLNDLKPDSRLVEVIIMSRNSPDTSLRIFNSIEKYGLDITRAALTGGASAAPYLQSFYTDLFLSANIEDVQDAINNDVAAGLLLTNSAHPEKKNKVDQIRIAFDGDAVLFGAEAERIYQHAGIEAFKEHERSHANEPLSKGPFANFLTALSNIQSMFPDREDALIRTALVTSRNAPAHERAIKTLRAWNVRIDEAFFLGGVSKKEILDKFGAHIFFDDQHAHTDPAAEVVASAVVPYREGDNPLE
ncbi:5'-nucleotidase [Aristaeella lactis]|uniref:5'-nucleotidase n=1 Tax=Aristaeella lactis TaxID=3046383 RepID=A0AC61PHE3_9FIRM|nr:5'-nucleotidase [Aristaeella lactis]QUA53421.1 5'-nucleotidase [Aristaeella lactis]SMC35115.1 5'-nucleotidase [Aristaeella lactis]